MLRSIFFSTVCFSCSNRKTRIYLEDSPTVTIDSMHKCFLDLLKGEKKKQEMKKHIGFFRFACFALKKKPR
jgi:hypothetical protein